LIAQIIGHSFPSLKMHTYLMRWFNLHVGLSPLHVEAAEATLCCHIEQNTHSKLSNKRVNANRSMLGQQNNLCFDS
jgi:hypothetical protein